MSCVFLSKSILCCLPHSFLNKLADEFQSKCASVRRGRRGSSFKARWVWIILKMGQEEEAERGGGGKILVYQGPPPSPPRLFCLSFCDRGVMLWLSEDNPFWEPLQNRLLTILGDKKWVQLKLNQWIASLQRGRGGNHTHPYFHFSL